MQDLKNYIGPNRKTGKCKMHMHANDLIFHFQALRFDRHFLVLQIQRLRQRRQDLYVKL